MQNAEEKSASLSSPKLELDSISSSSDEDRQTIIWKGVVDSEVSVRDVSSNICSDMKACQINDDIAKDEKNFCDQDQVKIKEILEWTEGCKPYMDKDFVVVSYEASSNNGIPIDLQGLCKQTANVKGKLVKMFDFLENVDLKCINANMDKIRRQKDRVSEMFNNWEFLFHALAFDCVTYDRLQNCGGTLESPSNENYLDLLNDERHYYRGENCKLNSKYCKALSELGKMRELMGKSLVQSANGFHKRVESVEPSTSSEIDISLTATDTCSTPISDIAGLSTRNIELDYNLAKLKCNYEARLLASEKVHRSLEEQNSLLKTELKLLQSENTNFVNRYKSQELHESYLTKMLENLGGELETKVSKLEEEIQRKNDELKTKDEWLLQRTEELENDFQRRNELLASTDPELVEKNIELQKNINVIEKHYSISHMVSFKDWVSQLTENERLNCKIGDLKRELVALADKREIVEAKNSESLKCLRNQLRKELETNERLKIEVNNLQESNDELQKYNKSTQEIQASIRGLERDLLIQKRESIRLLQQAKNTFNIEFV